MSGKSPDQKYFFGTNSTRSRIEREKAPDKRWRKETKVEISSRLISRSQKIKIRSKIYCDELVVCIQAPVI